MIKKRQLKTGPGTYNQNVKTLMAGVDSPARHRAILTIAKKHNLTYEQAQQYQAQKIAEAREAKSQ